MEGDEHTLYEPHQGEWCCQYGTEFEGGKVFALDTKP